MNEPIIKYEYIGGKCPVQAEGTVNGEPFYFRARGTHWSFEIQGGKGWLYQEKYSDEPFRAGWMGEDEARAFINKAAKMWSEEKS